LIRNSSHATNYSYQLKLVNKFLKKSHIRHQQHLYAIKDVNELIPEHLQVKNVSERSGKISFITNGIQSGLSTAEIAASTKHKSMETLAGYAQKTDHIMGTTGLSIAKRANELKKSKCLGGVETAIDEPAKKLRRRDTNRGGDAARRDEARVQCPQF
jgi:hypothetical protein